MSRRVDRRQCLRRVARTALTGGIVAAFPRSVGAVANDTPRLVSRLNRFLWESQHPDGRWSSRHYGVLRSGQALTPFVLFSLLDSTRSDLDRQRARAAIGWIRQHLRDGCLGVSDPDVLEYPVYATSLALRCLTWFHEHPKEFPDDHLQRDIGAMRASLGSQQFDEERGFSPDDLPYGGWGFGGQHAPGQTGHMGLAHTRWALQALAASGTEVKKQASKAAIFLRLLQKHPEENRSQPLGDGRVSSDPPHDGGFYFSPIVTAANKGRIEMSGQRAYFRSYATATCEGLLALLAAGVPANDSRVAAARQWLESRPDWEYPAGIPREFPEPWGEAVYFYHQAVRAETYRSLGIDGDWPQRLIERLRQHVADDGSVVNRQSPLMKEDDPILCTALALIAATEAHGAMQLR